MGKLWTEGLQAGGQHELGASGAGWAQEPPSEVPTLPQEKTGSQRHPPLYSGPHIPGTWRGVISEGAGAFGGPPELWSGSPSPPRAGKRGCPSVPADGDRQTPGHAALEPDFMTPLGLGARPVSCPAPPISRSGLQARGCGRVAVGVRAPRGGWGPHAAQLTAQLLH